MTLGDQKRKMEAGYVNDSYYSNRNQMYVARNLWKSLQDRAIQDCNFPNSQGIKVSVQLVTHGILIGMDDGKGLPSSKEVE